MAYNDEKYSIFIVEDELIVRKALRYIIEQEGTEFEIIGEVTNGEEALEFLEQRQPNIMICDIMMPRMNGLELLHAVNLKYPEISTIVLSGYPNFEYVKTAFKYGVFDYILKSELESDHLLKMLMLVAKKQDERTGQKNPEQDGGGQKEQTGIYPFYHLIAIQPGTTLQRETSKQAFTIDYMDDVIWQAFGSLCTDSFTLKKNQVYLYAIGFYDQALFEEKLHQMIKKAQLCLSNIEMIISPAYQTGDRLEEKAKEVSELFPYRFFDCQQAYLDFRRMSLEPLPPFDQNGLCVLVRQQKVQAAGQMLGDYLESLRGRAFSASSVKKVIESALYNTIFELNESECFLPQLEEQKLTFLTSISNSDCLQGLISAVAEIYQEIEGILHVERDYGICLKIKAYLNEHYHEPITLKTLAQEFNMNYTYLSAYFSSHMGQGINEYLNTIRVERAKDLLSTSTLSLSKIAQEIGYTDQSYFGKVFKKQTGHSPHSYRNFEKRRKGEPS